MKKLTKKITKLVFNFLINANGETTTLDVKEFLRTHGYWAEQEVISKLVNKIAKKNKKIEVVSNGTYNVFNLKNSDSADVDTNSNFDIIIYNNDNSVLPIDGNDDWVVFHKDKNVCQQVHVYKGAFNRDYVRNQYRKLAKVNIQDTRAKRFKRYSK